MCISKPAKANDIIGAIKAIIVIAAIHSMQAKNIWSRYCLKCSFFIYNQYWYCYCFIKRCSLELLKTVCKAVTAGALIKAKAKRE